MFMDDMVVCKANLGQYQWKTFTSILCNATVHSKGEYFENKPKMAYSRD